MKKMSLDQTWTECLKMWERVCDEYEISRRDSVLIKADLVGDVDILNNCYFCEYAKNKSGYKEAPCICVDCPGRNVECDDWDGDNGLWCNSEDFDYEIDPIAFYAELKRLNKIRLARKSKKGR